MLHTHLTDRLGLRYPIIGAPMAGVAGGALARAITLAGGLGMFGVGSETPLSFIETEADVARGEDSAHFGIGLMIWAIERRPELFDAAVAAAPFMLSLSFGSVEPYVERAHDAGILVATQVNSASHAREAERAGVDLIVAQGTEAGGHSTGPVATLPLLQIILEAVSVPVVAAGGIASARGLASALAAGAQGAWAGSAFLACSECTNTSEARRRVIAARETDTILTGLFDRVQGLAWPRQFPGRALQNRFSAEWHGRVDDVGQDAAALEQYREARAARDYDTAVIYAGQGSAMVAAERPAADVVREMGDGAEVLLRHCCTDVLDPLV
jgi:nitronate monooxygenase